MTENYWPLFVGIYITVSIAVLLHAVIVWSVPMDEEQRRTGARLVLTCWAWPIWALCSVVVNVPRIWKDAWR